MSCVGVLFDFSRILQVSTVERGNGHLDSACYAIFSRGTDSSTDRVPGGKIDFFGHESTDTDRHTMCNWSTLVEF